MIPVGTCASGIFIALNYCPDNLFRINERKRNYFNNRRKAGLHLKFFKETQPVFVRIIFLNEEI
jgi:hypothetical protein